MTESTLIEMLLRCDEMASAFPENRCFHVVPSSLMDKTIAAIKHREWIKIEDIPEEWKDGRKLDLLVGGNIGLEIRHVDYRFEAENDEGVFFGKSHPLNIISTKDGYPLTHAMLPPRPPEQPS